MMSGTYPWLGIVLLLYLPFILVGIVWVASRVRPRLDDNRPTFAAVLTLIGTLPIGILIGTAYQLIPVLGAIVILSFVLVSGAMLLADPNRHQMWGLIAFLTALILFPALNSPTIYPAFFLVSGKSVV